MELPVRNRKARRLTARAGAPGDEKKQPGFPRFAAEIGAARAARSPLLALYPVPSDPRLASGGEGIVWRPHVRSFGIGAGVLLFGVLLGVALAQPIGAAFERVTGNGLASLDAKERPAADMAAPHAGSDQLETARGGAVRRTAELRALEEDNLRLATEVVALRARRDALETVRQDAEERIAELQSQREQLRASLAAAENDVKRLARNKRDLEDEVTTLRGAASAATDAARQNLLALEEEIRELNAALGPIE